MGNDISDPAGGEPASEEFQTQSPPVKDSGAPLPAGCGLWIGWMFMTLLGGGIGWWLGWVASTLVPGAIATPVLGSVMGTCLGLAQWPFMAGRISMSWRWVAASAVGWSLGFLAGAELSSLYSLDGALFGLVTGLVTGAFLGTLQWVLLRGVVTQAGWWIPVNIFAWGSALLYYRPSAWLGLLIGALAGIVTAIALLWLFHRPE
jgi:hypothetical protein